jgi:hypothetical protein
LEGLEDRRLLSAGAELLGKLPLAFEANVGQAEASVRYLAHGSGFALALTDQGATLALNHGGQQDTLQLELVGGNPTPALVGLEAQTGHANYLLGNDPAQWHRAVPLFGRVASPQVYPGIDLVYYGNDQQQLEYDLDLAPGADPSQISLRFAGQQGQTVDAQGDLVLHLAGGDMVQQAPVVYQQGSAGTRTSVASRYVLRDDGTLRVTLGAYDGSRPLVIDPILTYSTYLGGSGNDQSKSIAVDSSGNVYVGGYTYSFNFPTVSPFQSANSSGLDGFVAKLNAAGALVYATYIGGSNSNFDARIAADDAGNAYVVGSTNSTDFPTRNPVQGSFAGGGYDAFVAKLNATGGLVYSTYLGGSGYDVGNGIAADAAGNAYVDGYTTSTDFPTDGTIGSITANNRNAFVVKLNAAGGLGYSLLVGGSGDTSANVIAVNPAGNAYITGYSTSINLPVSAGAVQPVAGGGGDVFVAEVNGAGTRLVWSTYLGGSGFDTGNEIAVDRFGNVYVTGNTSSTNWPTASPAQASFGGGPTDVFVTELNATGTALVYSTYLGGSGDDVGGGIAVDLSGNTYVSGYTSSTNFPTVSPLQAAYGGGTYDCYVAKLNSTGALVHSTYLGGSGEDECFAVAVDEVGNAYVTGYTTSTNFPTASPLQATNGGGQDAFVAKLLFDPSATGPLTFTTPTGSGPNNLTLRRRVSLLGDVVELLDNNVLVAARLLANTTGVQITGAANVADNLMIDNGFGGPIQVRDGITFDGGPGGGNTLVLVGTTAADSFTLTPTSATIDSVEVVSFSNVQGVTAFGGAGDTASLYDGPGNNVLLGTPTYATLSGPNFSNTASGFAQVSAFAARGSDTAYLFDPAGNGLFIGTPTYSYFQVGNSLNIVSGFQSVRGSSSGSDLALLFDSTGNDLFVGTQSYSYLGGGGFLNLVAGFTQVRGSSAAGGQDAAFLSDSPGNDLFRRTNNYSFLGGSGFLNLVTGFVQVTATAGSGGSDTADLYDSPGNDTFTGNPGASSLSGAGYTVQVAGFATVSVTGGAGGSDEADLGDSPGNDSFTAQADGHDALDYQSAGHVYVTNFGRVAVTAGAGGTDSANLAARAGMANSFLANPTNATLSGPGYMVSVSHFKSVRATASSALDQAQFTDAADDVFIGTPTSSTLQSRSQAAATAYTNVAVGFAQVVAVSSGLGSDTANLYDSPGADAFTGSRAASTLAGPGYSIRVQNFLTVLAYSQAGGQDTALLSDSTEDDDFVGALTQALLFSAHYEVGTSGFAQVTAVSGNGGTDKLFVQPPLSYGLQPVGNWAQPKPDEAPPPPQPVRVPIG